MKAFLNGSSTIRNINSKYSEMFAVEDSTTPTNVLHVEVTG